MDGFDSQTQSLKRALIIVACMFIIVAIFVLACHAHAMGRDAARRSSAVHAPMAQGIDMDAFHGWLKLTGNPKELTFEEWFALKHVDLLHSK